MTRHKLTHAMAALILAAAILTLGCSKNSDQDQLAEATPNLDSIGAQVAQLQSDITRPKATTNRVVEKDESVILSTVYDVLVIDSTAYSVYDGGLVVTDLASGLSRTIHTEEPLFAVAKHNDQLYAGGTHLYRLVDSSLVPLETQFQGSISALCDYGAVLMIGTENGLYSRTLLGDVQLMGDVWVTALEADNDGLWVGTDGDGLYRWDGQTFAKRYLIRDSSLFDYVNCIEYSRGHLYVGTSTGLYIHDGGKWQTLTCDNGLPSNTVTTVDASGWIVYVGTDEGLVTWFNDQFKPVGKLESVSVASVRSSSFGVLVATEGDGLYQKSGAAVKMLFGPELGEGTGSISMVF
ncbi:MAG: hypothetical protein AB1644_01410 [Candidatus Zixiibacteriota bacterium]